MIKPLTKEDLPVYFDVDGTKVKVAYDAATDEVFGETSDGKPFPMIRAHAEGREISEEEFNAQ